MTVSNSHEPQQDWTIIQISDTHLMNQEDLEFVHMNPEHSFHAVMKQIQQQYQILSAVLPATEAQVAWGIRLEFWTSENAI